MKYTTVAELRSHLASWLKRAEKGERILIRRHGELVAELGPATAEPADARSDSLELRLQELEREGFLRRGTGKWPEWARDQVTGKPAPLLEALLAEREEGR